MTVSLSAAVEAYSAGLAPAVQRTVARAAASVPAVAERLAAAGLDPERLAATRADNPADFDAPTDGAGLAGSAGRADPTGLARLPVEAKDDVMARQLRQPPFGGMLAPEAEVRRVFQSPGPLYEPQLAGDDPWGWAPALRAAGFGPGDTVLNCFGYHLSPAAAMFEEGALTVGARVLPGGIGNQDLQARAIADLGVTAYTGLPSYLKALMDRFGEGGLDPAGWQVARAVVTAEPLPDSLRALLNERVPTVLMAYGTAETGLIAFETEPGAGLVPSDRMLVEVCDLTTGRPVGEGEGQVVVTVLRSDYPLIRFGTGDLSAWRLGADGRPRLAGVLGRVGQAVKVRGMFLHPRQAQAVINGVAGVIRWRFLIDRRDHRDELSCELLLEPGADETSTVQEVQGRIRSGLRFNCAVAAVGALPEDAAAIEDRRDWT